MLNFYRAINPPYTFTSFATCLLSPKQNGLTAISGQLAIQASEKRYGDH